MGTTKSGRVMNTKGSGHYPSEYALIHSSEGDFTVERRLKDLRSACKDDPKMFLNI